MNTISQDLAEAAHNTTPALERAGDAARAFAAAFDGIQVDVSQWAVELGE